MAPMEMTRISFTCGVLLTSEWVGVISLAYWLAVMANSIA
jgi:hypothetical protein